MKMTTSSEQTPNAGGAAMDYLVDAWQRAILTWDVLRERGNQYLEHERQSKPPVLAFDYEMVLDGAPARQPGELRAGAHHAGRRTTRPPTRNKRPFVVFDPRAGHGPGIGGFKIDSQIGVALQAGAPLLLRRCSSRSRCRVRPSNRSAPPRRASSEGERAAPARRGQAVPDRQLPGRLGADDARRARPQRTGPILLAGSPLSYWAGVVGKNPMRYLGGLLGGTWMASLAGDLGNGKFDGANLVNNFESLDPANTYWWKLYNLYAKVDTEPPRFLEFEKWWGGHFLMNKRGDGVDRPRTCSSATSWPPASCESFDGRHRVDLRNIRSPIVVFASWGDNITPPQQALDWIPDLYQSVDEIRLNDQTIVYCLHEKVGHLGIFVSARSPSGRPPSSRARST